MNPFREPADVPPIPVSYQRVKVRKKIPIRYHLGTAGVTLLLGGAWVDWMIPGVERHVGVFVASCLVAVGFVIIVLATAGELTYETTELKPEPTPPESADE